MTFKNKEKKRERERGRYKRNEKYRKWMKSYLKERHKKKRLEVLLAAGGIKCIKCGFFDYRALQIDHVNGGGKKDDYERASPERYMKIIKQNPKEYQVLCANCNWIKKYENEESGNKYIKTL